MQSKAIWWDANVPSQDDRLSRYGKKELTLVFFIDKLHANPFSRSFLVRINSQMLSILLSEYLKFSAFFYCNLRQHFWLAGLCPILKLFQIRILLLLFRVSFGYFPITRMSSMPGPITSHSPHLIFFNCFLLFGGKIKLFNKLLKILIIF